MLRTEGYDVVTASNGKECLMRLKEEKKIDLILLDVMMPEMDGWETLRKIRESKNKIPVAMLTAVPFSLRIIEKEEIEGIVDYIQKPFTRSVLIDKIRKLLNHFEEVKEKMEKLASIMGKETAEEYENLLRARTFHQNLLNLLSNLVDRNDRALRNVLSNESHLIEVINERITEIERSLEE